MDNAWQKGTSLLIDAAGPESIFGLLTGDGWVEYRISENPFLEDCQPVVDSLVRDNGLSLGQLSGVIFAAGPGSTLGLRLAALFIRSLLQLPHLHHWNCYQYNNLELAAASLVEGGAKPPVQAIAPWRRDRLHRVTVTNATPLALQADALHPDNLEAGNATLFILGNRPRNLPSINRTGKVHANDMPHLFVRYKGLLKPSPLPVPFIAEVPEFARWSTKRHSLR